MGVELIVVFIPFIAGDKLWNGWNDCWGLKLIVDGIVIGQLLHHWVYLKFIIWMIFQLKIQDFKFYNKIFVGLW